MPENTIYTKEQYYAYLDGPRGPYYNSQYNASCPSVYTVDVREKESIVNLVNSYNWKDEK